MVAPGRRLFSNVGEAAKSIGKLGTRLGNEPRPGPIANSFNDMASALQERIERDATFTHVSHELRSPLMTLAASIQVLENKRNDMPDRAKDAVDMLDRPQRFEQLVTDLLDPPLDMASTSLNLMEVRLAELVMQSVGSSTDADVPLDIDAELAGVVVQADKRRLSRDRQPARQRQQVRRRGVASCGARATTC